MPAPRKLAALVVAVGITVPLMSSTAVGVAGVGIPAVVVDCATDPVPHSLPNGQPIPTGCPEATVIQQHPTTDLGSSDTASDDRTGTTRWRVVKGTGNCCEIHLGSSSDGRLFDIGGRYVLYTEDQGQTWKSVRTPGPLVNGEGSLVTAPNGDILATEWDAYTGDHLLAYKYNAASRTWFYLESPLHQPVYDRPWIVVIPGPFPVGLGADSVPYISIVSGGTGIKDPMYASTDGLTYAEITSPSLDSLTDTPTQTWFPIKADASFDWIQPLRGSSIIQGPPITPLGGGRALAATGSAWLLDPKDRTWDAWTLPDGGKPPGFIQIDSLGRIHEIRNAGSGFEWRISSDGGRSWTTSSITRPLGGHRDFKVNAAMGLGAIVTRVGNQDWVYKLDVSTDRARLVRVYRLGLGDTVAATGLQVPPRPRYDFSSISILPDGRVAATLMDSTTFSHPTGSGITGVVTPAVAIEMDTSLPAHAPDLTAGSIDLSTTRVKGADEVTFRSEIANVGLGDAHGVTVRFTVNGEPVGPDVDLGDLAGGEAVTVASEAWSARHQPDGTYTVRVEVDPGGTVLEGDESNNSAARGFLVEGQKVR